MFYDFGFDCFMMLGLVVIGLGCGFGEGYMIWIVTVVNLV